jgi:hypothetical protein
MPGLSTLLTLAVLDGQTRGDYAPYVIVFLFGMLVAIAGHIWASRELILAGILIAGVSAVMPWVVWS